ncbi:hypothetical protein EV200_101648 [Pedobacter psychrotolerans]|uniref:Uncharacterized protein n=1 Tax=Pedobacter psychrotolerans TaxID=1843235 RepID=A0A4R2HM33_9SPHI|nr:hypothetical protein EV200_101648 [Pedobacter psychrotolerans]
MPLKMLNDITPLINVSVKRSFALFKVSTLLQSPKFLLIEKRGFILYRLG